MNIKIAIFISAPIFAFLLFLAISNPLNFYFLHAKLLLNERLTIAVSLLSAAATVRAALRLGARVAGGDAPSVG